MQTTQIIKGLLLDKFCEQTLWLLNAGLYSKMAKGTHHSLAVQDLPWTACSRPQGASCTGYTKHERLATESLDKKEQETVRRQQQRQRRHVNYRSPRDWSAMSPFSALTRAAQQQHLLSYLLIFRELNILNKHTNPDCSDLQKDSHLLRSCLPPNPSSVNCAVTCTINVN